MWAATILREIGPAKGHVAYPLLNLIPDTL